MKVDTMKADKGRRQCCRRIRLRVAQAPIEGVSDCSRAVPAASTSGRAARSDSAPPPDADTSGSLQTAILLHVGRPPGSDRGGGAQKTSTPPSYRRRRDRFATSEPEPQGEWRKESEQDGRLQRTVAQAATQRLDDVPPQKSVLCPPRSLFLLPPRVPERNRPESSADSPVRCPWAPAAMQWRSPDSASFPSQIGAARIKP